MRQKPRFNPEVTRVKLNPEQAVLTCACYRGSAYVRAGRRSGTVCVARSKTTYTTYSTTSRNASIS